MDDPQNRITREQKIGLILLSAFVVLTVSLGLLQVRNTMKKPFALNSSIPPLIGEQVNTPDALRYRDTDMDGLNDFDELYIYATSPYLADTDSDGISDRQEVEQGNNPNCAEGKTCDGTVETPYGVPTVADNNALTTVESPGSLEEYLSDPQTLRTILSSTGVSDEVLSKLTDDDLARMAAEIFASSTLMNAPGEGVNVTATAQFVNEAMSGGDKQQ